VESSEQRKVSEQWATRVISIRRGADRTKAKREGRQLAGQAGLDADRSAALDIVIHELATNLITHAQRGEIWLRTIAGKSVEVAAIDAGPGIQGLGRILRRTSVTGLTNVRRLSQDFDVNSEPTGTRVRAVIGPRSPKPS